VDIDPVGLRIESERKPNEHRSARRDERRDRGLFCFLARIRWRLAIAIGYNLILV
jgi:hypothetical protein